MVQRSANPKARFRIATASTGGHTTLKESLVRRLYIIAIFVALVAAGLPYHRASAQAQRCFPETGQCISGRFRAYWEQNGGLPVFGFPITPARQEVNRDTGQTYLTQWFERNRFELHPENAAPYDVLLGRLGDDQIGRASCRE